MRKGIWKRIAAITAAVALLAANSMDAFASGQEDSVSYNGRSDFTVGADKDLFRNMKELMPGAEVSNVISIRNNSNSSITFYLKAEPDYVAAADGVAAQNSKSGQVLTQEGKQFAEGMLDLLTLMVEFDGRAIYQGPASGTNNDLEQGNLTDATSYGYKLGTVGPKTAKKLTITLKIPGSEFDNRYQNAFTAVDWIFYAEGISGGSGDSPDGGDSPGSGDDEPTKVVVIDDAPVPQGSMGEEDVNIVIEPGQVPLASLAKTGGGRFCFEQLAVLLVVLITGLAVLRQVERKRYLQ